MGFRVHGSCCGTCRDVLHSPCCVAMSCGAGFFTPGAAYDAVWDSVRPMTGKFTINYFQYQEFVGCVCMLNGWFSNIDDICADNFNFSRFKLKDKCRSEQWEVYLYGDMTIKVMWSRRAENCGVLRSCSSWRDGKAFLGAVYTGTRPGVSPAIRAGEGVAGTPGACSQVFCHPN